MGKLLSLWRRVGLFQKRDEHAKWAEEVSKQVDEGVASAVAGLGLFPSGDTINVGANADGSIVVNGDNIQVSPALQATVSGSAATIAGSDISGTGGFDYLTQATWYVNSATGNDANDGATALTPLLTLAELGRRWQGRTLAQNTTINLSGTFTEPLQLFATNPLNFTVTVVGQAPTQTGTGSLTAAFVAYAPATNVDAKVTDAAQTWAPLIGHRVRMTSGAANGAIAWLIKDLGANVARVSQFVNRATGAAATPAAGDTYVTETLATSIWGYSAVLNGGGNLKIVDIESTLPASSAFVQVVQGNSNFVPTGIAKLPHFDGCKFSGSSNHSFRYTSAFFVGCLNTGSGLRVYFSEIQLYAHCCFQTFFAAQTESRVSVQLLSVAQAGNGWGIFNQSIFSLAIDALGAYDVVSGGAAVDVEAAQLTCGVANGIIFGSGNTIAQNVRVRSNSAITYTTKPVITGTGNDALIGGTPKTWGTVPYVEPANNAMIVARV